MNGTELWKKIEKEARQKYYKDESWELRMANVRNTNNGTGWIDIRLNHKDSDAALMGVVYIPGESEVYGNDCNGRCDT